LIDEFVKNEHFRMDAWVAVSDYLSQKISGKARNEEIVRNISSGTNIPEQTTSFNRNPFRLAYVGRLEKKQKNIDVIADFAVQLIKDIPEVEVHFYGNGSYSSKIDNLIESNLLEERVLNHGLVSTEKLTQQLQETQAILLFSDYEGMPSAMMEGMASGVVPICWDEESGVRDLVQDNENGCIINRYDYKSFRESVERLMGDEKYWTRLSQNAHAYVEKTHAISVNAEKWHSLIHKIAGKNRRDDKSIEADTFHTICEADLPAVHPGLAREDKRNQQEPTKKITLFQRAIRKLASYAR